MFPECGERKECCMKLEREACSREIESMRRVEGGRNSPRYLTEEEIWQECGE